MDGTPLSQQLLALSAGIGLGLWYLGTHSWPRPVSSTANANEKEEEGARDSEDRDSQSLLNLLYQIAEAQAVKEGYVHRGITCNRCHISPIRGYRYKVFKFGSGPFPFQPSSPHSALVCQLC